MNLRGWDHECYTTPTGFIVYSTTGWCSHRWKELEWLQEWDMHVPFVRSFHCNALLPADMKVVQMVRRNVDRTKLVTIFVPARLPSWPYRTWLKHLYLLFLIHPASKVWEGPRTKLDNRSPIFRKLAQTVLQSEKTLKFDDKFFLILKSTCETETMNQVQFRAASTYLIRQVERQQSDRFIYS